MFQRFQLIARRGAQEFQCMRYVELGQLADGHVLDRANLARVTTFVQRLRILAAEAPYHLRMTLRFAKYGNRKKDSLVAHRGPEHARQAFDQLLVGIDQRVIDAFDHALDGQQADGGHVGEKCQQARFDLCAASALLAV